MKKNEQFYKYILRNDIRYTPDGIYRMNYPIGRFPPDEDYVVIKDGIPEDTKNFFMLCKENRLLEGIIQFHSLYYTDESYQCFINSNAKRWFDLLNTLEEFWCGNAKYNSRIEFKYIEADEYTQIKEQIHHEIHIFEDKKNQLENEKLEASMAETIYNAIGYTGEARFSGRDIPQKIEELPKDNDIDFP